MLRHLILATTVILLLPVLPAQPAAAREICFPGQPGISNCVADQFAAYWETNGGLPVFGYPIGPAQADPSSGLTVQWFERVRLEYHPDQPAAYRVLLGRMGAEGLARLGRDPAAEPREEGARAGCRWFPETGHNVCDQGAGQGFKSYWERNGLRVAGLNAYSRSLQLFGLPLSAAREEIGGDGQPVLTQWFERARFEWHPGQPERFRVLLGLLGRELYSGGSVAAARPTPAIFGLEVSSGTVGTMAGQLNELRPAWVRYNGIVWSELEAEPGVRDWGKLAAVEAELRDLAARGSRVMLIVRGTPAWAQRVPGSACGPIKPEALDQFASFVAEAVTRYSAPPYNVKYWEIGNEPDANIAATDSPFGCWGDPSDPYFGGEYYAEMLKRVYPAIKAADPQAQVLNGGLLLNCDPTFDAGCQMGRFLEGVLRNGGATAFDMLAYHAYMYWGSQTEWDLEHPGWKHRGGITLGKLDYIRTLFRQYGVDKPVVMNEGSLLCYQASASCAIEPFYVAQSNYAVRLFARSWAAGLAGSFWYMLNGPGWQEGGLLDATQRPRPAYHTITFMSGLLSGASYAGPLSTGAVEGYAFRRGDTTYQVYWTNDGSSTTLPQPPGTRAVYDRFGTPLQLVGDSLTITFDPIFVEVRG